MMRLDGEQIQSSEEFRVISLESIFNKEYNFISGGEIIGNNTEFSNFILVNIINGVPTINIDVDGVSIVKLDSTESIPSDDFFNLHKDIYNEIYSLKIEKELLKPILLYNVVTESDAFVPSNILIKSEHPGELNILEVSSQINSVENSLQNNIRVFNINNTVVNYNRVDLLSNSNSAIFSYRGYVNRGNLYKTLLNNSGNLNINYWDINLVSKDAECRVNSVVKISGDMRHASVCRINHLAPETFSSQEFRHILNDSSYAMYDGDSFVDNIAKGSSTEQHSKTIMLSDNSRIFNKPRLNIFTGEVKATHGASVGRLDKEDIFYLSQRGLQKDQIKEILVNAFIVDIVDSIKDDTIREFVNDKR